jgi:hypothetical protein
MRWTMWIKEVEEQINMLNCGNKTHWMESFLNLNMKFFIVDLFENEDNLKDLMDMVSLFVMQVAKKDDNVYPPTIDLNTLILICYLLQFNVIYCNQLLFATIECIFVVGECYLI